MKLRRATMKDAKNLFAWRNDPEAYGNFSNPKPITWEEHKGWMERNVDPGNAEQIVVIAEDKIGAIGMIRFSNRNEDSYEVAINIAPERRGDGNGGKFLSEACAKMKGFLVAEVKNTNVASRRIFEKCGFEWISEHHGFVLYRRPRREAV